MGAGPNGRKSGNKACCCYPVQALFRSRASTSHALSQGLPAATRKLFRLAECPSNPRCFSVDLVPGSDMDEGTRNALRPLVDMAATAVVFGARRFHHAGE